MSDDPENEEQPSAEVKRLPVRFKAPPGEEGTFLRVVDPIRPRSCNHGKMIIDGKLRQASFNITVGEIEVECSLCGTRVDPMWVLLKLAREETSWHRARKAYVAESARLAERTRTKCDKCGHMTRISKK